MELKDDADDLRKTVIIKLGLKAERGIALIILFLFLDRVSGWPRTLHVAENGPEFPILLLQSHRRWDYRRLPLCLKCLHLTTGDIWMEFQLQQEI